MSAQTVLFPDERPLREVKREFFATVGREPTRCPCCQRAARIYTRALTSEMAVFLVRLAVRFRRERRFYHTREVLADPGGKASTDACYLVHFGLVEQDERQGWYRPTPRGLDFVDGRELPPRAVTLFDNHVRDFATERVDIKAALGTGFDLDEVRQGAYRQG
ncbi:MAG: hypothetical protein ACYTAN_01770 [Planctomycetota bacterium]